MSAHSEAMSQDEDNQGVIKTHLIAMDNDHNAADAMYIVHHVPEDQLDQMHQQLEAHNQSDEQAMEMNEFIQMKQDMRSKLKGKSKARRPGYLKIKKEVNSPKSRHKNFSDSWLTSSVFKHWLERHPSSNTKAICKVCNKVLLAGKSELLKHGASKKHLQFMQASSGWKTDCGEEGNENSADVNSELDSNGFDEEWLEDPLFRDWLSSHPDSPYKAFCKACNKVLLATKSQLIKHRQQKKHRDCLRTSGLEESVDISGAAMDTFDDDDADETPEYTLEEADNEEPAESHNSETPYKVFRVKPTRPTSTPYSNTGGGASSKLTTVEEEVGPQAVVTQPAPSWRGKAVVGGHVREIALSDYKGRYLVMFFYPQDFSTVCSTEILALGDVLSAFRVINCEIVAVSVDSHLAHLAWTKTLTGSSGGSGRPAIDASKLVPLLSDSTHSISKTYGCYQPSVGHSLRAYYIIDKRGYLRAMSISDIQVGRNLKEILRLVEAFQLVDSTDTQCPVNWTTGQPSVKVAL